MNQLQATGAGKQSMRSTSLLSRSLQSANASLDADNRASTTAAAVSSPGKASSSGSSKARRKPKKSATGTLSTAADSKEEQPRHSIIDGFQIPNNLNTPAAVHFVLTQERDKRRLADVKKMVAERQQETARQQALLESSLKADEKGSSSVGVAVSPTAAAADANRTQSPGRGKRTTGFVTQHKQRPAD